MTRPAAESASPSVSVVMPVFDARSHLQSSLPPLLGIRDPRLLEVIVVDDGSRDGSAELAAELGARVLASGGRQLGPAAARNVGADQARGELLLFVDADVVIDSDCFARIVDGFREPDTVAVFGSYDDRPRDPGFMSQYMNLRHHHGHQSPSSEAATFWAGLGAVRRDAFLAVGGFDAQRFARPSVEDIELGYRLRTAGGRIRRDPQAQATHLKRWSLVDVIRTDVLRRAIPWSRLVLEHPGAFGDLNLRASERWRAALAGALILATLLALGGWLTGWIPIALLALAALANRPLASLFVRANGWWFAIRATLFHQLHYAYSALAFAFCLADWHLRGRTPARTGGRAGPDSRGDGR